jgi:probable HAF family extracellular repeat protein
MKSWVFLLGSCLCAAAAEYTISELPACEGGQVQSVPGITERGAVVWSCWNGLYAEQFLLNRQGSQSLGLRGDTYMLAMNRHEQIVGWSLENNTNRVMMWARGQATYVAPFGGRWSFATGINDHGDIVGGASVPTGVFDEPLHPFLYRKGVFHDLGTFGEKQCQATAINNKGTIVLHFPEGDSQPMAFYEEGVFRKAPPFSGASLTIGQAINEAGSVAGVYWRSLGAQHAFYYRDGQFADLSRADEFGSETRSINANDQVVGWYARESEGQSIRGGFLYQNGVRTEIQDLLPPNSGWLIRTAEGINDDGQIVGAGLFDNQERPYILTPVRKERH